MLCGAVSGETSAFSKAVTQLFMNDVREQDKMMDQLH